jgi:hypothetical protein
VVRHEGYLRMFKAKDSEFKGLCKEGHKSCEVECEAKSVSHKTATLFIHILSTSKVLP